MKPLMGRHGKGAAVSHKIGHVPVVDRVAAAINVQIDRSIGPGVMTRELRPLIAGQEEITGHRLVGMWRTGREPAVFRVGPFHDMADPLQKIAIGNSGVDDVVRCLNQSRRLPVVGPRLDVDRRECGIACRGAGRIARVVGTAGKSQTHDKDRDDAERRSQKRRHYCVTVLAVARTLESTDLTIRSCKTFTSELLRCGIPFMRIEKAYHPPSRA